VTGNDDFVNVAAALTRSCDVQVRISLLHSLSRSVLTWRFQHNQCANKANSKAVAGLSVPDCDAQNTKCQQAKQA
jgi:hypothetical protein